MLTLADLERLGKEIWREDANRAAAGRDAPVEQQITGTKCGCGIREGRAAASVVQGRNIPWRS